MSKDGDELYEAFTESMKVDMPCVLCGRISEYRAIFAPDDSQLYGAPKGKYRNIIYGTCKECAPKSENDTAKILIIENRLRERFQ